MVVLVKMISISAVLLSALALSSPGNTPTGAETTIVSSSVAGSCEGCAKNPNHDTGNGKIEIESEPSVQNGQCDPISGGCKRTDCPLEGDLTITNTSGGTLWWQRPGDDLRTQLSDGEQLIQAFGSTSIKCKSTADNCRTIDFYSTSNGGTKVATWSWCCTKCSS